MDPRGGGTARPFAAAVFKWRAVAGAAGVEKPPELTYAEVADEILRRWPGYTLSSLYAEDAHELFLTRALLDESLGAEEPNG